MSVSAAMPRPARTASAFLASTFRASRFLRSIDSFSFLDSFFRFIGLPSIDELNKVIQKRLVVNQAVQRLPRIGHLRVIGYPPGVRRPFWIVKKIGRRAMTPPGRNAPEAYNPFPLKYTNNSFARPLSRPLGHWLCSLYSCSDREAAEPYRSARDSGSTRRRRYRTKIRKRTMTLPIRHSAGTGIRTIIGIIQFKCLGHLYQIRLAQGRTAHGYIFSGHRGIGKTTVARILAAALNCRSSDKTVRNPAGFANPARKFGQATGRCN